jgi:hypothetical protein
VVTPAPVQRPDTNSLLLVDIGRPGSEIALGAASRVEGRVGGDLLIAAPRFEGDLEAGVAGLPVLMRWTGPRGMYSQETELVGVLRGQVTTWRVRPVDPVRIVQRRSYARASLSTPIALIPVAAEAVLVITGWLNDLSEGGLRARVSGVPLAAGTLVEARLELEKVPVVIVGSILRLGHVDRTRKTHEIVALLDAGRHADRIRRVVLRQQMLARRGRVS